MLWYQLDLHSLLLNKCLHNSSLLKVEWNTGGFTPCLAIWGSLPTVLRNNIMEHFCWVDAMLHSRKLLRHVTFIRAKGNQGEGKGRGRNNQCCDACWDVYPSACMCSNKEKVLDAWNEKPAGMNTATVDKEIDNKERWRGSHGGCKKGSYTAEGGVQKQHLRLT